MRRSLFIHAAGMALALGLVLSGCSAMGAASSTGSAPTIASAVSAIPTLEVAYPASFNLAGTTKAIASSRSITGTAFDPSQIDDVRSGAWVAFKKEIANPDGPDINSYIKTFQAYITKLASISTGSPMTMPSSLGKATFTSSALTGGGLETIIYWTLPRTISAPTVKSMSDVSWPSTLLNTDGSANLTFNVYMDIKQDSTSNLSGFTLQLVSTQTYTPTGSATAIPYVKISATNDGAGTYELYSLYYGNIRYEKSTTSNGVISFVKEIDRPYPQGLNATTGVYDYPNGREFYYYGYGSVTQGGITYIDYDPKYAADPNKANDIYLYREVFDNSGHLLFKQYGLTSPANSQLLASYNSTTGINLASAISGHTVSAGSGSGTVTTSPWKLTITYAIDSNGNASAITSIKTGGGVSLTPPTLTTALPPKFYYEVTDGASTWAPGDAVYYPQQVTSANLAQVTQVFTRGYTVQNTASVAGINFYISNKYPLKYMALSGNTDSANQAYNSTTATQPYAFYDWLGTPVTGQVWYDLSNVRHTDGYYVPKLYWVSKQAPNVTTSGNQVVYKPTLGDVQITGVEMALSYTVGTDPTTGMPTLTPDYVPMLSTTALSAPSATDLAGATPSGYYGELPLFLNWTSQAAVTAVLSSLEGEESAGVFLPGALNLTSFLASTVMTGFQTSGSFPTLP